LGRLISEQKGFRPTGKTNPKKKWQLTAFSVFLEELSHIGEGHQSGHTHKTRHETFQTDIRQLCKLLRSHMILQ
jgi:hypothetical protein